MRVAALRDLLNAMPDDLLVTLNGKHVTYLYRHFEQVGPSLHTEPHTCDCGHRHSHMVGELHVTYPATIDLCSRHNSRGRGHAEPIVEFCGRWTKEMRAAIDRHSDDPDARTDSEVPRS